MSRCCRSRSFQYFLKRIRPCNTVPTPARSRTSRPREYVPNVLSAVPPSHLRKMLWRAPDVVLKPHMALHIIHSADPKILRTTLHCVVGHRKAMVPAMLDFSTAARRQGDRMAMAVLLASDPR
jgi:hypothetical protein